MKPAPPDTSVLVHIPASCRMAGEFTLDHDVRIEFGSVLDETCVVFERTALERFTTLAHELLAVPANEHAPAHGPDDPDVPGLMTGDRGVFIHELHTVSELMTAYAHWALDPTATDVAPVPFEEQVLLSARLAALGDAVRELAYAWAKENERAARAPSPSPVRAAVVDPVGPMPARSRERRVDRHP